jgi:hypothetical protein
MDGIDRLLEEILVDAYGDSEQLTSFEVAFDESARLPFAARVVGANLEVVKVEFEGDERRGLTAVCRREGRDLPPLPRRPDAGRHHDGDRAPPFRLPPMARLATTALAIASSSSVGRTRHGAGTRLDCV